jgi:hypothetical protein
LRIGGDHIDNGFALFFAEQALGVGQIRHGFDDAVHRSAYYGIAVVVARALSLTLPRKRA